MKRWLVLILVIVSLFGSGQSAFGQVVVRRSSSTITLEGKRYHMHTVSAKETLYAICKAYGVSEKAVVERNPFLETGLRVGQMLFIPLAKEQSVEQQDSVTSVPPSTKIPNETTIAPQTNAPSSFQTPAPFAPIQKEPEIVTKNYTGQLGLTAHVDVDKPINIAMLLPFGTRQNEATFVDFYRGALVALDELKESGISVNLNLFSTNSSAESVQNIVDNGSLDKANLIIGPVYDRPFEIAANYAISRSVPIVSPLAPVNFINAPFVIEAACSDENKWDKVVPLLTDPQANVIFVDYHNFADSAVVGELASLLPLSAARLTYQGKPTPVTSISQLLVRDKQNIFILPVSNENAVEGFLARLSSINAASRYKISVVGTSRWARFAKLDFELFFKLGVIYPSSYHADRSNDNVAQFYNLYIEDFGTMPSLFSFRGYDVTKTFASLIAKYGSRALLELAHYSLPLLQMPYRYSQKSDSEKFINTQWGIVTYNSDYSMTVN